MSAPSANKPSELPDLRLWLLDQWKPGRPFSISAEITDGVTQIPGMSHMNPKFDRESLQRAALWWVSADMVDLLNHAAPTLDVSLSVDMIPDEAGLVVFEKPLLGHDAERADKRVRVNAILWGGVHLPPLDRRGTKFPYIVINKNVPGESGVGIASYRKHDVGDGFDADEVQLAIVTGAINAAEARHLGGDDFMLTGDIWIPIGRSDWIFGDHCDTPVMDGLSEHMNASMAEDRRWLAALWLLASQKGIASKTESGLDRPTRRRSERRGVTSAVRIIDLRHRAVPGGEHRHGLNREWHQRWIVSGHWRNQAYGPARSLRRPKWIAPYEKGPDDKPLVIKPTVKVVR